MPPPAHPAATLLNPVQLWALYCLVLFYTATRHELAPIRPLSKFLVVKARGRRGVGGALGGRRPHVASASQDAPPSPNPPTSNPPTSHLHTLCQAVVFLSYWQGVAISVLVWLGVVNAKAVAGLDVDDVAAGLQEFLICVEMFFAALAHAYAFPPSDYMVGGKRKERVDGAAGARLVGLQGARGTRQATHAPGRRPRLAVPPPPTPALLIPPTNPSRTPVPHPRPAWPRACARCSV